MKKEIIKVITRIFTISIALGFSFPSWKIINAKAESLKEEMVSFSDNVLVYKNDRIPLIMNTNHDFKPSNYIVNNISNFTIDGKVLLMYSKMSTIDYNDLLININGTDFDLSKLLLKSNNYYHIFIIDDNNFKPNLNKEYLLSYKVKENTLADNIIGKYFDTNIEVIEY